MNDDLITVYNGLLKQKDEIIKQQSAMIDVLNSRIMQLSYPNQPYVPPYYTSPSAPQMPWERGPYCGTAPGPTIAGTTTSLGDQFPNA